MYTMFNGILLLSFNDQLTKEVSPTSVNSILSSKAWREVMGLV